MILFHVLKSHTLLQGLLLCYCCWLVASIGGRVCAQQSSYQEVGADFLEGKDVYSLLEDPERKLWIGTDEGLYMYDGFNFKYYHNPELKNRSVFSLHYDSKGTVYYANFAGQIVRVYQDSLEVFCELPDSLRLYGIDLEIDEADNIIVIGKYLIKINQQREIELLRQQPIWFSGHFYKDEKEGVVLLEGQAALNLSWKNGNYTEIPYKVRNRDKALYYKYIYLRDEKIRISGDDTEYLKAVEDYWERVPMDIPTISKSTKRCLSSTYDGTYYWCSCWNGGIYRYHIVNQNVESFRWYPEYQVSHYQPYNQAGIWIGTFKKGVLRIPHDQLLEYSNHDFFKTHTTVAITEGEGDTLYGLTKTGLVYELDPTHHVHTITTSLKYSENYLQYVPETKRFYFNGVYYDARTKKIEDTFLSIPKSIQLMPSGSLLVAAYTAVGLLESITDVPFEPQLPRAGALSNCSTCSSSIKIVRPNVAYYQANGQRYWIGNNERLIVLEGEDSLNLKLDGQPIIAFSIASNADTTYVATAEGILTFVGTQYKGQLLPTNAPLLRNIRKLVYQDGWLYIGSTQGFQRVHLTTQRAQILDKSRGLLSNKIIDFALLDTYIYLLTGKGIQRLPYTVLDQPIPVLKATFESILVEGEAVDPSTEGYFNHNHNRVECRFKVAYLGDRSTLQYHYRLIGHDSTWLELPIGQNKLLYNALKKGCYTLEVRAIDNKRLTAPIARYSFVITPPFWETWWFVVLCIVGIAAVVSLIFLIRINILKQQNTLLLDKKAVEKQLIESQQTALRAQMNPHFLFNALNSIQEMIVVNNKRAASTYLGKFADLMRLYLNHSQEESVTLAEELDALKLYLELEQVRFEDSLTIDLEIAPDLSLDTLTLPPMLLQPYVENAFKHGLLHQMVGRHLKLVFALDDEQVCLCCHIQDNGIGRLASAQLKQARQGHQSFASSATERRLTLLNYNKKNAITVDIEDLVDELGQALGTTVHICIPLDWQESGTIP